MQNNIIEHSNIKRRKSISQINELRPKPSMLTAVEYKPSVYETRSNIRAMIKCVCECGGFRIVPLTRFLKGMYYSCGCKNHLGNYRIRGELAIRFTAVKRRCYDPRVKEYASYGAKGVVICDEWLNDFEKFYQWSIDNGYSKNLQLDKDIKGNGKLYSPETCCWVTPYENNTHNWRCFIVDGAAFTIGEIIKKYGRSRNWWYKRIKEGIDIKDAINEAKSLPRFSSQNI